MVGYLESNVIKDPKLAEEVQEIVWRMKKGLPVYLIMFGPTRSGKTTVGLQICHDVSLALGNPFDINNVFFFSDKLRGYAHKKVNYCFQLDEASYNLMSADRQGKEQLYMQQYMNTAAKYGQLIVICMPHLEQLKASIIKDFHSIGIEMYFRVDKYKRNGRQEKYLRRVWRCWNNKQLNYIYDCKKKNLWVKNIYCSKEGDARKDLSFMDIEKYESMKDDAIDSIGPKEASSRDQWVLNALASGLKQREVAKIFGISLSLVRHIVAENK